VSDQNHTWADSAQNRAGGSADLFDHLSSAYESPRNRRFYAETSKMMTGQPHDFGAGGAGVCCLDLACGTGISTEVAIAEAPDANWFAVDGSAAMLRIARDKSVLRSVTFLHSPAEAIPLPSGTFNWILCNIAYHWLPPIAVQEIERLLLPNGRLSLIVPLTLPSANESGNRWLRGVLARFSRILVSRRSQGLTLPILKHELRNFHLDRADVVDINEEFTSFRELLETLDSRSSLHAIFGDHAAAVKNELLNEDASLVEPMRYCWKFARIEARPRTAS
jgi:ubiquinone/menaquinone biosynthesis C-methylase UbiE